MAAILKSEGDFVERSRNTPSLVVMKKKNFGDAWWIGHLTMSVQRGPLIDLWQWQPNSHDSAHVQSQLVEYRGSVAIPEDFHSRWNGRTKIVTYAILLNELIIAEGFEDGNIEVSSLEDMFSIQRTSATSFKGHTKPITCLFSPHKYHGRYLISAAEDCKICIWDLSNGKRLKIMNHHTVPVTQILESPTGSSNVTHSFVYTIAEDQTIGTISLDEMRLLHVIGGYACPIYSIHLMQDMNFMLVRYVDQTVMVWDMEIGCLERTLRSDDSEALLKRCEISIRGGDDSCKGIFQGKMTSCFTAPRKNNYLEIVTMNLRELIHPQTKGDSNENPVSKEATDSAQSPLLTRDQSSHICEALLSTVIISRGEPLLGEADTEVLRLRDLPGDIGAVLR